MNLLCKLAHFLTHMAYWISIKMEVSVSENICSAEIMFCLCWIHVGKNSAITPVGELQLYPSCRGNVQVIGGMYMYMYIHGVKPLELTPCMYIHHNVHTSVHVYSYKYIHVCTYMDIHVPQCAYICTSTCKYMYIYMYMYSCRYLYMCMTIHIVKACSHE